MLQITQKKKWPFVKMADAKVLKLVTGVLDWDIPGDSIKKGALLSCLGRVIANKDETMQTDSRLLGGDSGGPLFDFEGQLLPFIAEYLSNQIKTFMFPLIAIMQIGIF